MKVLGIFRGFPGLGRVVGGVSLLEELRDCYGYEVKIISYLQGKKYLDGKGYTGVPDVCSADYCSIGLLPTNKFAVHIFETIQSFSPDLIIIDGEPLMLHSIKISFPFIKVVVLLNPSDVENPSNDKEAMDYFNANYSMADLAIVHGLKSSIKIPSSYDEIITTNTILRREILELKLKSKSHSNCTYCILGGGTINSGKGFLESTIRIGEIVKDLATLLPECKFHVLCGSLNIYNILVKDNISTNVILYERILPAEEYYKTADAIITRSGRNTLSELAYLGIPAIAFITGDKYRIEEQRNNIESLNSSNVVSMGIESSVEEIAKCLKHSLSFGTCSRPNFSPGNKIALLKIRNFIESSQNIHKA